MARMAIEAMLRVGGESGTVVVFQVEMEGDWWKKMGGREGLERSVLSLGQRWFGDQTVILHIRHFAAPDRQVRFKGKRCQS